MKLNYEKVFNVLKNELKEYIKKFQFKSICIGISGGIDSTVSAAICYEVAKGLNIPLIGLLLPSSSNKVEENNSALNVAKAFTTDYRIININKLYEEFESLIPFKQTPISRGNILARARMTIIRNVANITKGLTIDNTNFTEYNLGFFTVNDNQDYCLIRDLWKTEVYGLAKYIFNMYDTEAKSTGAYLSPNASYYTMKLDALKQSINLTPTDGLGISNSDLDQIGAKSYEEVDAILQDFLAYNEMFSSTKKVNADRYLEYNALYGIEPEVIKKVLDRHIASEFKRKKAPIYIERKKYEI